jgi:O-antigen/teichoic acid export membrane protein
LIAGTNTFWDFRMLHQLYHRCRRGFAMRPLAGSLTAFSAAQAVSLAAGLLLHATAARFLTVADYGRLAVTHSVLLVMLVALNHGIPNALRRAVSLEPALLGGAWRRMLAFHLPLAIAVSLLLAAFAPLASRLLGDGLLTVPLQVVAADVALRAGLVEPAWLLFNGAGRHRLQAALMAAHSLFRCAAVAGMLALGFGLTGAVAGLLGATALSVLLAVGARRAHYASTTIRGGILTAGRAVKLLEFWLDESNVVLRARTRNDGKTADS